MHQDVSYIFHYPLAEEATSVLERLSFLKEIVILGTGHKV